jgi:hypothetical protein
MKIKIGKTFYYTNDFLSESSIIGKSNIKSLLDIYNYKKLDNLDNFNLKDDTFIIDSKLENKFKRPKVLLLDKNIFIRDDLFFKIEEKLNQDPVLDYNTYIKIENEIEKKCLDKIFKELSKEYKNLDYSNFISIYNNEKFNGAVEIDLEQGKIDFKFKIKNENLNIRRILMKND